MNNVINPDGTVQYDKEFDGYDSYLKPYGSSVPFVKTNQVESIPQVARWRSNPPMETKVEAND